MNAARGSHAGQPWSRLSHVMISLDLMSFEMSCDTILLMNQHSLSVVNMKIEVTQTSTRYVDCIGACEQILQALLPLCPSYMFCACDCTTQKMHSRIALGTRCRWVIWVTTRSLSLRGLSFSANIIGTGDGRRKKSLCKALYNNTLFLSPHYFPHTWPASWSSGQGLWLLIMRSRVRFPVLTWEFFLAGKDSRGDHRLGS